MQTSATVERPALTDDQLADLKEKFELLLDLDRDSDEFLRLFAEVDAELDACIDREMHINVA